MADRQANLTPEQKIKQLEAELVETRMKAEFFEAVVEVMERDYGATLSKKRFKKSLQKNDPRTDGNESLLISKDFEAGIL